ncbi:MAG: DUF3106 domain-containing protein [Burkholderiales bacterium]|nr:DUF3106 domain-containing protein [Burkholderiales bacterium]
MAHALTQPKWEELTAPQREALKPLAGEWNKLDDQRRKKWLVVADRFPAMKAEEQKRMQSRMAEWARLTPEQRRVARENFQRARTLPPEQKKAEWNQYQKLPEAQKQQLAVSADLRQPARRKAVQREQEGRVKPPAPPNRVARPVPPPRPAGVTAAKAPRSPIPAGGTRAAAAPAAPPTGSPLPAPAAPATAVNPAPAGALGAPAAAPPATAAEAAARAN